MLPLNLKIKGLYSYQDEAEIDFTRLTDSHIFGIFGAVGSGKSSILEAISFALYGETERLNKKDNRGYNMMNLKSNELLIDFIFAAADKKKYRFTVSAKRNSKKFRDIRTFDRKAYKQNDDQSWEPISSLTAEEIIGLSYDNFRRTIIIPQGKFKEFLELGDKERTAMMKEIFNLHKYELYDKTRDLEVANNEKIQNISGQLTNIGEIDPEKIKEKQNQRKLINEQLLKLRQNLDQLENKERQFSNLVDKLKESKQRSESLLKSVASNKQSLSKKTLEFTQHQKTWDEVKSKYNNRSKLSDQIKDLQNINSIQSSKAEIAKLQERITNGEKKIKEEQQKQASLQAQSSKLKSQVAEKQKSLAKITDLTEVKAWFTAKKVISESIAKLEEDQKLLTTEIEKISQHNPAAKKEDLRRALDKYEAEKSQLSVRQHLSQYAAELVPGKPCLLCGSKAHPEIHQPKQVTEQMTDIQKKITDSKDELSKCEKQLIELSTKTEQQQKVISELQEQEQKLELHQRSFKWEGFDHANEEAVNKALADSKSHQEEFSLLCKEQEVIENQLAELTQNIQRYSTALQEFQQSHSALSAQSQTLTQQLSVLKLSDYTEKTLAVISEETASLSQELKTIESRYQELEEAITKLEKEKENLAGIISAEEKSLQSFQSEVTKIESELKSLNYNEAEYQKLLAQISVTKNEVTSLNQQLGSLDKELATLEKSIADQQKLAKELASLQNRGENITILKNLFKGSGFVNYVSSVYLQELCQSANQRFHRLTRQALQLEITDDNSFQVRDFLNNGEVRSVKTLSGGQSFQASLSLALALADSVQKLSKSKQSFFFLDEGFGTLDQEESLQIVFDTLKSLRSENKTVGIISHLEKLKQEIEVYLEVKNDREKGSAVRVSF